MEVEFGDAKLDRLETDRNFTAGFGVEVVRGFRKAMQVIRAAADERDLYNLKGLRFEKLDGARSHQRSVRLNKQWRLILELVEDARKKTVRVIGVEDYH
ncbi:MAG TPA: type II toxin-antitoxin system RelE/ParE family toxin [Tepidisphaeraceae bacterium]|nr:type II toxin-antitoxin system RelE/ParE family toxin [Tepidisphaeraceae bacterium]